MEFAVLDPSQAADNLVREFGVSRIRPAASHVYRHSAYDARDGYILGRGTGRGKPGYAQLVAFSQSCFTPRRCRSACGRCS